jgi:integrase
LAVSIERIINDLLDEGKAGAAKEALKQIGTCYSWATGTKRNRRRVIARSEVRKAVKQVALLSIVNPADGLSVPQYHQRSYHFKNAKEFLPKLAKSAIRQDIQNVLRLQFETFARVGEVAGLRWTEIDLKKRQWLLPAQRSKTGTPHLIMLSKQSATLLRSLKNDSDYVFPKPQRDKPLDTDDVVKGINKARESLKVHKDFSSHSLRHTGKTWLASQGCPAEVSERLLNHSMVDMSDMNKRYDHHEYEQEKRVWTQKWCDYLAG